MKFGAIRKFVFGKLSAESKHHLINFFAFLKPKNLLFFVSFGAVKRTHIEVRQLNGDVASARSREIIEELTKHIDRAQSRNWWPADFRLRFLDGMSGQSFRALLNLMFSTKSKSYLEIGTWKGSTFCSAIYGNSIEAICVDDWSEFGGPSQAAIRNIGRRVSNTSRVSILSTDFRKVAFSHIIEKDIDVYFFDGPHSQEDHFDAVKVLSQLRFSSILFIVDDWNWDEVREGTFRGLETLDIRCAGSIKIFTDGATIGRQSRWHNGYAFFVLEK